MEGYMHQCEDPVLIAPIPVTDPWLLLPFLLSRALLLARRLAVTRLAGPDCRALLSLTPLATVLLSLPLAREHTGLFLSWGAPIGSASSPLLRAQGPFTLSPPPPPHSASPPPSCSS